MGSSANQAAALADAVRAVGEQLIAANPIGKIPIPILLNCYAVVLQLHSELVVLLIVYFFCVYH
jgi:hypothetical protein